MGWIGSYLEVAAFVGLVAFIIGDSGHRCHPRPAPVAALAFTGIAWPVLLVGLAQFILIVAMAKSLRARPAIRST